MQILPYVYKKGQRNGKKNDIYVQWVEEVDSGHRSQKLVCLQGPRCPSLALDERNSLTWGAGEGITEAVIHYSDNKSLSDQYCLKDVFKRISPLNISCPDFPSRAGKGEHMGIKLNVQKNPSRNADCSLSA